ncbi:integrase, catalytic region, zinc finger, CCHC-type containing protein [Tanacetum coccineum]
MTTLAEFMILSSADNRPPMLEKDLYDSWKSRIELYMQTREHGKMILESIEHGSLIWPTIEENGVTKTNKYEELSATEKIQADCDLKATNIILQGLPSDVYSLERECKLYDAFDKFAHIKEESLHQYYLRFTQLINDINIYKIKLEQFQVNTKFLNSLPPEWSKFVTDVKLVKDLHTTNFDQLNAYLEHQELHANEVCIFQQQFSPSQSPQYGSIHPTQHYSTTYPSIPLAITYPSAPYPNPYSSIVHQDACPQPQSISKIEYTVSTVNQQTHLAEFPQIDSGLVVHVFKQGDDPIDAINKIMSFMSTIVITCFLSTNNQLRNYSNPRQQATIHDGRVTVQPVLGRQPRGRSHGKTFPKAKEERDTTWFRDKVLLVEAQGSGKVLNKEELAFFADPGVVEGPVIQTAITHNAAYQADDLDAYDSDCDEISTPKAVLMANLTCLFSYVGVGVGEVLRRGVKEKSGVVPSVKAIKDTVFVSPSAVEEPMDATMNNSSGIGVSTNLEDTMNDNTPVGVASTVQEGVTPSVVNMIVEMGKQKSLDDTTVPESFPPLSMPVITMAGNALGKSSYANITGKPSGKKVNVRTLFIPGVNGIDVVVLVDSIRAISECFVNTTYGFFLGKKVAYPVVANYVRNTSGKYGLVRSMFSLSTGLFSFQFRSMDGLDAMLENGLWFIRNKPLILKKWHPDENLLKEDVSTVLVWAKLNGVPVTAFNEDGLSAIATKLGTPLIFNSYTSDMCMQSWGSMSGNLLGVRLVRFLDIVMRNIQRIHVLKEYRPVPKKRNVSSSGNKKKGVEPTSEVSNSNPFDVLNLFDNDMEFGTNGGTTNLVNNKVTSSGSCFMNVDNSSSSNTPIIDKIMKFEDLLTSGQAILVDKAGNPLKKVEFPGEYDSEDEVASVDNDMARSMTFERVGFSTQSLLEQWKDSYGNGDYDDDPYDNDMYEGQDLSHELQAICDNLDIRVRGRKKK